MAVTALVLNSLTWSKMRESIASVHLALETGAQWESLLSSIKDAEISQRGYVLTGDEQYLKDYEAARSDTSMLLARVGAVETGKQMAETDLPALKEKMRARNDLAANAILVRKRDGLEAALKLLHDGNGKSLMDDVRTRITGFIQRQQDLATQQSEVMKEDLRWGYISSIASGFIALLAGGVALFLIRDAAARGRREERLAIEKRRAEESNRQKSTFLATMSHEIRTPMNAILGFGELLASEPATDKQRRYTQSILAGGRALLQLINDILDLSKIEAGMLQIREEPTDVRDVGAFALQLFHQQAAQKNVALKLSVAEALPHSLLIDNARLRQILINVVGNALKFTDKGHVIIRFDALAPPDNRSRLTLRMEVEDTGCGIPEDQQAAIFEAFVQGVPKAGADLRGTGLGLSIVRRLVDLMDGTIELCSAAGQGSTFRFEFPGVEVSARLPTQPVIEDDLVNFNDLRASTFLVADDNATNRDLVEGMFEKTHHKLRLASGGAEAVKAVLDQRPDLVLMDIRMPGMDGREALHEIRSRPELKLLPVIAVTASSLSAEERELRRTFDGHVQKPFTRAALYRELAHFIPKNTISSPPSVVTVVEETLPPEQAARWRELAVRLHQAERETWPALRDGMLMSELKTFATTLEQWARKAACPPLEAYARQMAGEVESFAISSLEHRLAEFPQRIKDIERRCQPPLPA